MIDKETKERYSNGDCWKLAYALNELSGWPIFVVAEINEFGIGWVHAVNKCPDGLYIDILGKHGVDDVWEYWNEFLDDPDVDPDDKVILYIKRDDFQKLLRQDPKEIGRDTYEVAKEIFDKFA